MTVQSTVCVEHKLNRAICDARISEGYEQYLELLNVFYADDVEVSTEGQRQPVRGKGEISSLLQRVLVPLHILAEIGSLAIVVCHTPIPSDAVQETGSSWRLDLVGTSGKTALLPGTRLGSGTGTESFASATTTLCALENPYPLMTYAWTLPNASQARAQVS